MAAAKFTFDTVFHGATDVASDGAKARQRKVLTQGELDKLVADARSEGVKAGEVRALEAIALAANLTAQAVREALVRSRAEIEAVRAEASALAFVAAKRLASGALAAAPAADVERALRDAMHQAIGEPRLLLRANPAVADALAARIEAIVHEEGFEGRVQIVADPAQRAADCRLEWRGGGAERSQAAIETAVSELIERRFANPSHPSSPED